MLIDTLLCLLGVSASPPQRPGCSVPALNGDVDHIVRIDRTRPGRRAGEECPSLKDAQRREPIDRKVF